MTDKKDKDKEDVVVNLFKDKDEHIMTTGAAQQIPTEHFTKLVIDQIDRVKDDADKLRKLFYYTNFSCKKISFISNIKFFFYLLYLVNKITRQISNQKIFKPK